MSIISTITKKVVEIVGVVTTSTLFGKKRVKLDVRVETGEYFPIVQQGLRIASPAFASTNGSTADPAAPGFNAAFTSDIRAVTIVSEAARRSSGGHNRPLVFAVLPDLEQQKKHAPSNPSSDSAKARDLARRGHPTDDDTLSKLKDARALYAHRMCVAYKCLCSCVKAKKKASIADKEAFDNAGLKISIVETLRRGSILEKESLKSCVPHLLPRADENLCRLWQDSGNHERLILRVAELTDAVRAISKAIAAYEQLAPGKTKSKQEMREGKFPTDSVASERIYGSPQRQEAAALTFVEKMRLALYTGVNPSDVWPDTIDLGDGTAEERLFHGATLVSKLNAGHELEATTAELRPLFAALLQLPKAVLLETEGVRAKSMALCVVHATLHSLAPEAELRELLKAVVDRDGKVKITPMNVEPSRPLSSLNSEKAEYTMFVHDDDPDPPPDGGDDIYWARNFWRPSRGKKKTR